MGSGDNTGVGFQSRHDSIMNCPSSQMSSNPLSENAAGMVESSMSMYKPSNGDPFFGSGWDPIVSLSQSDTFGGSSAVSQSELANTRYPVVTENQETRGTTHFPHYPPDSSFLAPRLSCFGSGNFSDIFGSFGLPQSATHIGHSGCTVNYASNQEGGNESVSKKGTSTREEHQLSEEGATDSSPNGKRRKRPPECNSPVISQKNVEEEPQDSSKEGTEALKENNEKKPKIEQNSSANLRGKQVSKQSKDSPQSGEAPKENYIHVRARRGQATNSHSLAERVRREKISERMRLLQELVPGCNKITGKAVMLDEIINYVQSLQQQVEFLSMKLATVNPELNFDIERILSKDILHSRGGSAALLGFGPGLNSSHAYSPGIFPGTMSSIPSTSPQFPPLPKAVLDNELQSLFQMGFDSTSAADNVGPNGRMKSEL